MEKEMPRELERALQEIEQLRQENAQLRKKLGMEVSQPKADYRQSGLTSVGSNSRVEEAQEDTSYGRNNPIYAKPARVGSNFSAEEKIKLFRILFRAERMCTQYSGSMNEPERRVIRPLAKIRGVRRKERQRSILL